MNKMRRKLSTGLVIGVLLIGMSSTPAYAVEPSQQTFFNSFTDFFATMGKSSKEKARIKRDRQNARRSYRMRKQQTKNQMTTQKRIKKQQQEIMKKRNAINESRYNQKKK